jgi:endonuclease/exonuclease/phosphatase (EEP) superfamily protein YafD
MLQREVTKSLLNTLIAQIGLGAIAGITLLGVFTSQYGWSIYLENLSHFQLQYLVLNLLLLCVLSLTRRKFLWLTGLMLCAILATQVMPWYLSPKQLFPQNVSNFRIFIANINTKNNSYERVISLVRRERPDVAVFMEVNDSWIDKLNSLSDLLPYSSSQSSPYNLGLVIYSKSKLFDPKVEFFGTRRNASVITNLEVNNQSLFLVATHPLPPAKPSFFHSRNKQLELVSDYIKTLSQPVLLVGDLNLTMWSPYYKKLVNETQLKNAREGFGVLPTWPTPGTYQYIPSFLSSLFSIPIDHCLHSRELKVIDTRVGAPIGSDHLPLIVDLHIRPSK